MSVALLAVAGRAAARLEELPVRLDRGEVEMRQEEIGETLQQVHEADRMGGARRVRRRLAGGDA